MPNAAPRPIDGRETETSFGGADPERALAPARAVIIAAFDPADPASTGTIVFADGELAGSPRDLVGRSLGLLLASDDTGGATSRDLARLRAGERIDGRLAPAGDDGAWLARTFRATPLPDVTGAITHALVELAERTDVGPDPIARRAPAGSLSRPLARPRYRNDEAVELRKMEALSRLACGIAHDFNNALAAILGFGRLLLEDTAEDDPSREDVAEIVSAGERAEALVKRLLALSRHPRVSNTPTDVAARLAAMRETLERLAGDDVNLVVDAASGAAIARIDPGPLEQIVTHLVTNAREASPSGGTISLAVGTCPPEVARSAREGARPEPPDGYVTIEVADTGRGIADDVLPHIYEPYFSTKERGKGLGLTTVFNLVHDFSGHVEVETSPSSGTRFIVYVPRIDPSRLEIHAKAAFPPAPGG